MTLAAHATQKSVVIFIHGTPGTHTAFDALTNDEELKSKSQLVSYDRPIFKIKDGIKQITNIDDQVEAVESIINQNKDKKIILVGYSYGAVIAIKTAEKLGNKISSVITIAGIFNPENVETNRWLSLFKYKFNYPEFLERLHLAYYEISSLKANLKVVLSNLDKITSPVTAIQGTKDNLVSFENADFLKQKIRENNRAIEVKTILIENGTHKLIKDAPAQIKNQILKSLDL